jgi:hypothetical protein
MVSLPTGQDVERTIDRLDMTSTIVDESQRTTALAFWRYAHDYLRVARALADQHKLRCAEAQAVFHVAAQGLEFALKSFLRAKGLSADDLRTGVGHSLADALDKSFAHGLGPLPAASRASIETLALHHQQRQFTYLDADPDAFADVSPYVAAGIAARLGIRAAAARRSADDGGRHRAARVIGVRAALQLLRF